MKLRGRSRIGDIHAETEILKITAEEPITFQTVKPRRSSRDKNAGTEATTDLSQGDQIHQVV